ncbi:dihydroxyacetone kinase DhaL subunit [Salana multivorans]|uniref:Dihydroxyacetone kinase DhaL subunit n=1 Tax=Salana multivorans TaxID=120377 RepID=A0A3N2D2F8_9MICO|nr:dihydroxyacetone kinase subunit DhaL [Salana multivorans]OJX95693.1 MAG: dihydroxyacetone kinase subunit L [Micrococcales bacterium 73-15]ROR93957.1 dihydroxyacetone kinase DhaL subunit [Salana multivorans]
MTTDAGTPTGAPDGSTIDVAWARRFIALATADVLAHRVELSELDREIGDGDHGENLARGFTAADAAVQASEATTVGGILKLVATTLMSTVGGAAGPLYGTAFLRAAKVSDVADVDAAGVHALLEAALGGIVARGKANVGDKTMVDAWTPAVAAASEVAAAGGSAADALAAAARAAGEGAEATIPLVALKGRASYLGERSAGHKDPGAASTALLLDAAARAAAES